MECQGNVTLPNLVQKLGSVTLNNFFLFSGVMASIHFHILFVLKQTNKNDAMECLVTLN